MPDIVIAAAHARALELIRHERSAVLSLCHEGRPRCFQMAVAFGADGRRVYLGTSEDSRKYSMLLGQPWVCLFFSSARNQSMDPQEAATLEVHGRVEVLTGAHEHTARHALCARHQSLERFFSDARTRVLAVPLTQLVLTEHFQEVTVLHAAP